MLLLAFVLINITRDLFVDTGIKAVITPGEQTIFTDNGFFAMQGVMAPENTPNPYNWARDRYYEAYLAAKEIVEKNDIPLAIPPADIQLPLKPKFVTADNNLAGTSFDRGTETEISPACGSLRAKGIKDKNAMPCMTRKKLESIKKDNALLWSRFEKLPHYKICQAPQSVLMEQIADANPLLDLLELKLNDLFYRAKSGDAETAIREWSAYMVFFKACQAGHSGSLPDTAFQQIFISKIETGLNDLILINPKAAIKNKTYIDQALTPFDDRILIRPFLMTQEYLTGVTYLSALRIEDDVQHGESETFTNKLLTVSFPSNGVLKRVQACSKKREIELRKPISQFNSANLAYSCTEDFPMDMGAIILKSLTTSGNPIINFVHYVLLPGINNGRELANNIRTMQARMTMARLGLDLVSRNLTDDQIASEINNAPSALRNPLTDKPFNYDPKSRVISLNAIKSKSSEEDRVHQFHLPPTQ